MSTTHPPASQTSSITQIIPTQYSAEQLASLSQTYHFHWNSATYFVIIFSSLIVLAVSLLSILVIKRTWRDKQNEADMEVGIGESYLIGNDSAKKGKAKPTSKTMAALRGRNISSPMPSQEGQGASAGTGNGNSRGSGGTAWSHDSGDGAAAHYTHGW